jgi:hypothetical protein
MKIILACLSLLMLSNIARSQGCDKIHVDIEKGTINGLFPKASQEEVKKEFPCFSGETADGSSSNCGGGVFYKAQGFFFYTGKDNINIRKGFTGTFSVNLFDVSEKEAIKILGKPEGDLKDEDGITFVFFKKSYGCVVLRIEKDKVTEIFLYGTAPDEIDLCV